MAASWFNVGSFQGGSLYIYTGMGEFRSHDEAVACFNKQPRSDREPVIIETIPLTRGGVEWGFRRVICSAQGNQRDRV
jgi:hypothetical protein